MMTQTCRICATTKPIGEFYRRGPNSYRTECRRCANAASSARQRANPERARAKALKWKRANREQANAISREWNRRHSDRVKETKAAWRAANPERARESDQRYSKEYREKNAEQLTARALEWRNANREHLRERDRQRHAKDPAAKRERNRIRRARKHAAEGHATQSQIDARAQYYGGRCYLCSAPYEHMDHVKPLAKGGSQWPANLRPICGPCNRKKAAKWPYSLGAA